MAEAILLDQAKADDRAGSLRGLPTTAEADMRALLRDRPTVADNPGPEPDDGDVEVTNIVDFAGWVSQLAGAGDG